MKNGLCPEYLSSLIPANVGSSYGYSLHNANAVRTVNAKSQLYFNSFLPSTIQELNELPPAIQNSPTLSIFKNHLNSNLRAPPAYYFSGNRLDQINHTRVRTHCSGLHVNQHLFAKNIVPGPLCACGEIENTQHFLLDCILARLFKVQVELLYSLNGVRVSVTVPVTPLISFA